MINLKKRLEKLENRIRRIVDTNEDGFITALGVELSKFLRKDGVFDCMGALNETAKEDWKDVESETNE